MNTEKKLKQAPTFESVWAMMKETDKRFKETDKRFKENTKQIKDLRASFKETEKFINETTAQLRASGLKLDIMISESDRKSDKADRRLDKLGKYLGGIAHSNGEMAENYFYYAFKADSTFANEKFEKIEKGRKVAKGDVEAEFDILLFNGKSAVLLEVKYNAKPTNVSIERMLSRVEKFRFLFPECRNYNIYLGVAAMSFKEGLETELHQAGIATIRQIGKKMVVFDKDVKAF